MVSKFVYIFVVLAVALEFAHCQSLSCYDCDPINFASDCGDPLGNNVRTAPCPTIENATQICMAAFLNITGTDSNLSGIYRGCRTQTQDIKEFCDWFREERQGFNTTVVGCVTCNSSRCNTIGFNSDGTNASQHILASGIFVLLFNALIVILLNKKA